MKSFSVPRGLLLSVLLSAVVGTSWAHVDMAFDVQIGAPVVTEYEYQPVYEPPVWVPGFGSEKSVSAIGKKGIGRSRNTLIIGLPAGTITTFTGVMDIVMNVTMMIKTRKHQTTAVVKTQPPAPISPVLSS